MNPYHVILTPEIQQMLRNFYQISGLRIGIHDSEMNIISEYPEKPREFEKQVFCDKIRYYSPAFTAKCRQCDLAAYEHIRLIRKAYVYTCHSGFLEALIPILHGNRIVCALMIGQVQNGQIRESLYHKVLTFLSDCDVPEEQMTAIRNSFENMPCMDRTQFESFVYFLELCAQSIYQNRYIHVGEKSIIENFTEYIQKHLYQPVTIADTAKALNISASHLSRLIARELDASFTEYVTGQRVERAKELLHSSDFTVSDIAYQLKFNDPTYFMRVFKKITGMTCTEYRKLQK